MGMGERRMFTQKITESDAFLDMPLSSQALYFHLCMYADDDGFVKNPKRIARMIGTTDDDFKLLIAKSFAYAYDTGVIVIKHWRMHNLMRKDRYKPTEYISEKSMLYIKENGAYTLDETQGVPLLEAEWQPDGNQMATNGCPKLSKDKLSKDKLSNSKAFKPPTLEEITAYCKERKNNVDPKKFYEYFTEGNWIDSKGNKVKNWKQKILTWEKYNTSANPTGNKFTRMERSDTYEDLTDLEVQLLARPI